MSHIRHYTHEAMKTTFTLRIDHPDTALCNSIAQACVTRIDEIEYSLSRYIEGSEVWQINHLQTGKTLFLTDTCYDCLRIALDAYLETDGLFDITLGKLIEHKKNATEGPAPALAGQLMVDPERPAIHCIEAGREIDLGGIGKGYALDQMQIIIKDFGAESALLAAGASTHLAIGSQAWKVALTGEQSTQIILLENKALSASGTTIQGSHIISPRASTNTPHYNRIWVTHSSAAMADAWSTAAILMNPEELRIRCGELLHFNKEHPTQIRSEKGPSVYIETV